MKQNKGKYIRLTEQQMKNIIAEEVKKQLQLIMEYAEPRKKFVENVANISYQIIENWCLIRYCTLIGRTETKTHWKSELYAHIDNIGKRELKNNNNYKNRVSAINEGFEMNSLFNGPERISKVIKRKFTVEQIDIKDEVVKQVCVDCSENINNIIHIMANYFDENIDEFLDNI